MSLTGTPCAVCGQPLDDGRPIQESLLGGVHVDCVPELEPTEGEDE